MKTTTNVKETDEWHHCTVSECVYFGTKISIKLRTTWVFGYVLPSTSQGILAREAFCRRKKLVVAYRTKVSRWFYLQINVTNFRRGISKRSPPHSTIFSNVSRTS